MEFQVNVTNVNGMTATASYYDPITNTSEPITVVSRTSNALVLNIQAVDYPRLITINENGGAAPVISPPSSSASVPTGLSSPAQSRFSVALKWTASTDPSGTLAGYDIYRNGSIIATTSPTANSYSNCCSLTPSTSYTYSISAYDTANNSSAQSNSIKVSTLPDVPDTPQNLTASAVTSSSIKLTWTPKNDTLATIAGYDIYRNNVLVGTVSSGTSFTNTGLSANTSYQYYVEAYSTPSTNISAKSTVITVKTAP
jgi:chitodextrinase